jgi:hypothetical protein
VKINLDPSPLLDRGRESLISSSRALLLRESVRLAWLDRALSAPGWRITCFATNHRDRSTIRSKY